MNEELIKVKCPRCKHEWYTSAKRPQCSKCRYIIPKNIINEKSSKSDDKSSIRENIANGNILKAMEQSGIKPLASNKFLGDAIIHILEDHNTLLALGDASKKRRQSSKTIIRKAVEKWLKEEGYL